MGSGVKKNRMPKNGEHLSSVVSSKSVPRVDRKSDRTVFVGNISAVCTKKRIKQLFNPYGSVESVRLRSMKLLPGTKRAQRQLVDGSTFNAYVVFSSKAEAEGSLSLNGELLEGRHLRVDAMFGGVGRGMLQNVKRSVFVGNLPFSVDEEKLREVFSICGGIEGVRVVRDRKSCVGKGFGFINFRERSSVMFALKQNGKVKLDGRTLRVYQSKDQQSLHDEKQERLGGISTMKMKARNKRLPKSSSSLATKDLHCANVKLRLPSSYKVGKRRSDGTKNRYYRLPACAAAS